jgi:hypothetical protein
MLLVVAFVYYYVFVVYDQECEYIRSNFCDCQSMDLPDDPFGVYIRQNSTLDTETFISPFVN